MESVLDHTATVTARNRTRLLAPALVLGAALLGTHPVAACGCAAPGQPFELSLSGTQKYWTHSGSLQIGPGPSLHLHMRSYIWCHSYAGNPPDINPLNEPCDDPQPHTISDGIQITARYDAARTRRCVSCAVFVMVRSNAPLVYPVGREVFLSADDQRRKGVIAVSIYVHLSRRPTGATGSDVLISRQDRPAEALPYCSATYFGLHPAAEGAEHYPCGA